MKWIFANSRTETPAFAIDNGDADAEGAEVDAGYHAHWCQ
jgi:hypothetical protein